MHMDVGIGLHVKELAMVLRVHLPNPEQRITQWQQLRPGPRV